METTRIKIDDLSSLNDKVVFAEFQQYVKWLGNQDDFQAALVSARALTKALTAVEKDAAYSTVLLNWYNILWHLKAIALNNLPEADTAEFLRRGINYVLDIPEVDILGKLKTNILRQLVLEDRNEYKKRLLDSLFENVAFFYSTRKTTGEWLKIYNSLGKADAFTREAFVLENPLVRGLANDVREALRILLSLYDYLRSPSDSVNGSEDQMTFLMDGHKYVYKEGEVYQLPTKADPLLQALLHSESIPVYDTRMIESEVGEKSDNNIQDYCDQFVIKLNLSFKYDIGKKRFLQLLVSYLKEVRDLIEVQDVLQKSLENGGLGLSGASLDKVMSLIKQAKAEFLAMGDKPQKTTAKTQLDSLIESEAIDASMLSGKNSMVDVDPARQLTPEPKDHEVIKFELKSQGSAVSQAKLEQTNNKKPVTFTNDEEFEMLRKAMLKEIAKSVKPKIQVPPQPQIPSQPIAQPRPIEQTETRQKPDKPLMQDVKAPPRTLGPLEEIRALNLIDFRRLAPNPAQALEKVLSKISHIGEASIGRRYEAVRAWQNSALYQLYLKLGRTSIEAGKPVSQVITELESAGELTLTPGEFNAIVDFNSKLRF